MRRKKRWEFSKFALAVQYLVSFVLILATVIGTLTDHDVTALAALAGASILITGYDMKYYYWKARNENRAKYAQSFIKAFAEQYGIDAAIQVADTVLKE